MNSWIFQGKPDRYPLHKKLNEGERETWLVSRYKDEIGKDDIVLFWSSGNEAVRGLYGWGVVIQETAKYYEGWGYGIEILYKVKFENHIGVNQIRKSGILKNNVILKMPIGTNFRMSPKEYSDICNFINELGEKGPNIKNGGQSNG